MAIYKPRERKHRRLAKHKVALTTDTHTPAVPDSNVETIVAESEFTKADRREKLAAELRAHKSGEKISGKKKKRLDKYIDNKLRKDDNLELLKKLAAQQVDTSLFRSSKTLGRVTETKRERFGRALREKQAGIDVQGDNDNVLLAKRKAVREEDMEDDSEVEDGEDEIKAAVPPQPAMVSDSVFGLGLKRPLEMDESGKPVIKKRKRRQKPEKQVFGPVNDADKVTPDTGSGEDLDSEKSADEDEWNGFGSDDDGPEAAKNSDEELDPSEDESEEDDSQEDDEESANHLGASGKPARVSAFKQWADSVRNAAVGFTPSALPTDNATAQAGFKPRALSPDPLVDSLTKTTSETAFRPVAAITIPRAEDIQAARLELPVVQEEQKIMEAINNNPVVIICGATGSGKTTQVPQMMFENGYGSQVGTMSKDSSPQQSQGLIGVTQPRRVAAMSVAERVSAELGSEYRSRVAYQVRYDTSVSRSTVIKFMTDGILLREISQDFILSKYSVIVIDEAHERSVNTDILIGMLSRIVPLRTELTKEEPDKYFPLKLVIMSATLRVADFAENERLFKGVSPPIVQAEGRQFAVTEHFSRKTHREYAEEMVNKVARGHRKLPPGGMLVFLTSQNEIQTVAKRLKEKLGSNTAGLSSFSRRKGFSNEMPLATDAYEDGGSKRKNDYFEGEDDGSDSEPEITGLDSDADDDEFKVEDDAEHASKGTSKGALKPYILPLYAALPSAQQLRVFELPPDGSRLIVLATNVAETSLTIPGVRYVFDCGRSKEKRYDAGTGVQTYEIDWISKASAAQRAGRAGRTGPGHCYRLFSSAVYEQYFAKHTIPEILRTPLESTVLQLKSMEIDEVVNFPFPTSPNPLQLEKADRLLRNLGAIGERDGVITQTGRSMMTFPVNPRYARMLLLAQRNKVLGHTVALVAGLAVGDLFIPEVQVGTASATNEDSQDDDGDSDSGNNERNQRRIDNLAQTAAQKRRQNYTRAHAKLARWDDQSDAIKILTAVAAHASNSDKPQFCAEYFIREKGMTEVQQLRDQLHNIVKGSSQASLDPPSEKEVKMLNQLVTAGFIDQVAIRADLLKDETAGFGSQPRRAIGVPYRTLIPSVEKSDRTFSDEDQELQRSVFIHPSSVLAHLSVKEMPSYIIYSHLSRPPPMTATAKVQRTRIHPLATAGPKQLAALAEGTPLLKIGKPIGKIEDMPQGAEDGLKRRRCWVGVSLCAPGNRGEGWPMGAWKAVQMRTARGEWVVETVLAR